MAYEPTNWKPGDVVTSSKLNKMEQGIAGGGALIVYSAFDSQTERYTLDKTYAEIYAAVSTMPVIILAEGAYGYNIEYITSVFAGDGIFEVDTVYMGSGELDLAEYVTDSENGYPAINDSMQPPK